MEVFQTLIRNLMLNNPLVCVTMMMVVMLEMG